MGAFELEIRPAEGWPPLDFAEIWRSRDVLLMLVWRDIKLRYRQTLLGGLWAILQPLLGMLIFTVIFNRRAGVHSDEGPYPLFAFTGLVAWTFFANAVSLSSNSLIGHSSLISKIYFPRIFIPLATISALLLDLLIGVALAIGMLVYYRHPVTPAILLLPLFALMMLLAATGLGLLLSSVNVRFRDVKYAVPFFVQMGLFVTPVIYPLEYIGAKMRPFFALNPMTGVVLGFRSSLTGAPLDWNLVAVSALSTLALLIAGLFVFRRMEDRFADEI